MSQHAPVDLRSDTVTRPTAAMRRAMAEAEVGDDVLDGDPTVVRLEATVAEMLGKEAAAYCPSGTMANQCAVWALTKPGTEIFMDAGSHIYNYEIAGAAGLAGVQVRPVTGRSGVMTAGELRDAFRPSSPNYPLPSLVCVENTHNGAGGRISPLAELREIQAVARERRLPVHMDGARLWNASVASGTSLAEFAACADTVMVSFAKGLGAPVGAAVAGDRAVIVEARRARKRFGGGMRQSGIIAAGALYGVQHHLKELHRDHERARRLAQRIEASGAKVVPPDTNIVMIDLPAGLDSATVVERAKERGVLVSPWSPSRIRVVTHRDADDAAVDRAAAVLVELLTGAGYISGAPGPGGRGLTNPVRTER